jgi:pectate lyase
MQKSARLLALLLPLAVVATGCSDSPGASGPAGGSGGNASSGGTSASGGAVASGGTTSSPNGGSAAATGGNTSAAGGTTASAGGTSSALGGATAAAGGTTSASGGSAAKTGGTTSAAGGSTTASGGSTAALGGSTATTGGTTSSSAGGTAAGGTTSAGGSNGGSTASGGASGGSTASGGSSGGSTASGGTSASGGTTAKGGTTTAGGSTASGGSTNTGPSVTVSPACTALETKLAWPTAKGSTVTISGTKSVTTYDGGGALHEGTLNDCSIGDQSSTKPIIEVADGGSVSNVIFGKNIGDGIHCLGSCTIDNVWYPYICDDAITINKDGTASKASTISNSGFKGARDKIIQHNGGDSTLNITNVYAEVGGKLYRSCGSGGGCTTSAKHTVNISNVIAIGVDQVAGVSENDQVTLSNICAFRTPTLCNTYQVNSDTDSTKGANGTGEGPSPSCSYQASDSHALVDRVAGAPLATDVLCPGSNSAKSGSTATACIAGFDACLKVCAPGMYGFKQLTCSAGSYTSPATGGCALVTATEDSAAAAALASSNSSKASSSVAKNTSCSTEWAWGTDSSTTGNYCVCAEKPGYYQKSTGSAQPATWMVWDCQSPWW